MQKKSLKKTGDRFSRSQLLLLSQLTQSQFEVLARNGMIEKDQIAPEYLLGEVVYFRLIYLLRKEFTMQIIKNSILNPCHYYQQDILYSNYAKISLNTGKPQRMVFCEINTRDFREYLNNQLMCIDRHTNYGVDGTQSHQHTVWINLFEIIIDMFKRAIDYDFDHVEQKFDDFIAIHQERLQYSHKLVELE